GPPRGCRRRSLQRAQPVGGRDPRLAALARSVCRAARPGGGAILAGDARARLPRAAAHSPPPTPALAACPVSMSVLAIEAPVVAPLPLVVLPLVFRMNLAIAAQERSNAQLEKVLASQRRFLTDVSHQVATPLATIMTNLSIL